MQRLLPSFGLDMSLPYPKSRRMAACAPKRL